MPDLPAARRISPAITWMLVLLGVVALIVVGMYFALTADALPAFFPGHQGGSAHHHSTHGIAALGLGLVALLGAWMTHGNRTPTAPAA